MTAAEKKILTRGVSLQPFPFLGDGAKICCKFVAGGPPQNACKDILPLYSSSFYQRTSVDTTQNAHYHRGPVSESQDQNPLMNCR